MTVPVGSEADPNDLAAAVFVALVPELFDAKGDAKPFALRAKADTQDDPFDEHIGQVLNDTLPDEMRVYSSGNPNISPDLVVARPDAARKLLGSQSVLDSRRAIAIEVKKLKPSRGGGLPRASGMDYNSTPPCSRVKVKTPRGQDVHLPAFYLFAFLDSNDEAQAKVISLVLVSGAALNEDTDLYDRITGVRSKSINLGSYGDGADRERPMFIFGNPLGWNWTSGAATLIHERDDLDSEQPLTRRRSLTRTTVKDEIRRFHCYRMKTERATGPEPDVHEPFPSPANRSTETTPRGVLKIDFSSEVK